MGIGKTINMSSNGVLFTTDQFLLPGRRLELSISWPAQLNSNVPLKLVARGRGVRCEEGKAAIEIHQYEFRTASQGATVVQEDEQEGRRGTNGRYPVPRIYFHSV